ncbi:MAG: hypothetical protein LBK13_04375, partial [Spirochaetales bacterium]|nr:hypothetical protein [Spirochaetales bacterium]
MSGRRKVSRGSALILWHPAFCEAISMDLEPWKDVLEFKFEYELTTGPLKIDVLVIRKLTADPIKGNIATLFREYNILEYKSPEDYISVDNFYKVYGYACFYASLSSKNIDSLTISLVGSRYPKELLRHLEKTRGYRVEEAYSGI